MTTVRLNDDTANRIDDYVGHHGFTSRSDFVRKAVDLMIKDLETTKNEIL